MTDFKLGKKHKLCSRRAIDALFANRREGCSTLSYPLRAVWQTTTPQSSQTEKNPQQSTQTEKIEFLISVPKRKLRHAVDRVKMRRRIREAYRLNHIEICGNQGQHYQVAFIYIADHLEHYGRVERAMRRILENFRDK